MCNSDLISRIRSMGGGATSIMCSPVSTPTPIPKLQFFQKPDPSPKYKKYQKPGAIISVIYLAGIILGLYNPCITKIGIPWML